MARIQEWKEEQLFSLLHVIIHSWNLCFLSCQLRALLGMEVLALKRGMLSSRGHHSGSINFEEKTATGPFWALISLNMPKIRGCYTGWSDWGQLPKGNGVAATHWRQGGFWGCSLRVPWPIANINGKDDWGLSPLNVGLSHSTRWRTDWFSFWLRARDINR